MTLLKGVSYCRVSSKEQEKEGFSIPAQQKLLSEYAIVNDFQIISEYIDVETAKKAGREKFGEMVSFLKQNRSIKVVLVEKTDRLYRNFRDYVTLEEMDLEIHLVKEGEILSKDSRSHTKFIHGIKLLMAKNYIDNLGEEVRKGLLQKVEQGEFPGVAPLGYINNLTSHLIEVDPTISPMIRRMYEWYASGNYSLAQVTEKINKEGLRFRRTGKPITKSMSEEVLKNPIYKGEFKWRDKVWPGKHEPIVSRELFEAVQEAFERHNKGKFSKREFAFIGLLTCGKCGCAITAEIKKGKYVYYHCTGYRGKCNQPYIREEDLAERLGGVVKNIQITPDFLDWVKEALKKSHVEEIRYRKDTATNLTARLSKIQERLDKAYEDKLDGRVTEEFWQETSTRWKQEQNELQVNLKALQAANHNYYDDGVRILELANKAYSLYLRQTASEKRKLLNILLSNCTLIDGKPHPTYKTPFNLFINTADRTTWLPG